MGETIASLHVMFRECEKKIPFWDNSLLDEMEGWVKDILTADGWKLIRKQEYESSVKRLRTVYAVLPKQLIHRDVHFGNFLFQNGEFSGYIDFDLSQRNIRIFDLSYFLAGLLAKESGNNLQKEEWLRILHDVLSGYESIATYFISIEDLLCAADAADIFHKVQ